MPDRLTPCDSMTMIKDSFLIILKEKGFNEITVKEIVKKAGVGRSTFYLHYKDKKMLLDEIEKELTSGFIDTIRDEIRQYKQNNADGTDVKRALFTDKQFAYMRQNYDVFSILFRIGSETDFQIRFKREVITFCEGNFAVITGQLLSEGIERYRMKLFIEMCMDVYIVWLESNMQIPEEEMEELLALIRSHYMK